EASPLYRELLAQNAKTDSLAAARQTLLSERSLMLFYYLGTEASHLLVIGDAKRPLRAWSLTVTPAVAKVLEIKAGPLTRELTAQLVGRSLAAVQRKPNARDLTGTVTSPKGVLATDQEQALTDLLLPAEVRELVLAQPLDYLLVIPDGALHQLPFEALLLRSRPTRRYVVDEFPPIAYGPSASILVRLAQRAAGLSEPETAIQQLSVLTVGNPDYARQQSAPPPAGTHKPRSLVSLSRESLLSLSGDLPMLPGTAAECRRVSQAFGPDRTTMLQGEHATEAGVRQHLGGRRYIHLAAHGFVDAENENLFGAIALTPPANGNHLEDDGFLALHEIHTLSLRGCELAVLSACRTNVGPDRPLEAGSTLARAFLSAGVRRVVSSHWSVDDASTAELIGLFCEEIAKSLDAGRPPNYATALHYARQRVRAQSDWSEPYYWAPFVLIGPARK
ncbi:MAG: CHAT domain-containing protein, partial [Pirellulales bacterium]